MEIVTVGSEAGALSIEGGETACLLTVGGKPIQFCWFAEVGTTVRYLVGRALTADEQTTFLADYSAYQKRTELGRLEKNEPLSVQFHPLLQALARSTYELSVVDFQVPDILVAPGKVAEKRPLSDGGFGSYDTYGGLMTIQFTQSEIEDDRVAYYQGLIKEGILPIAVLFSLKASHEIFVLDGHHKILAYKKESAKARALWIRKVAQKEFLPEEGIQIIRKMVGPHGEYERIFSHEKENGWYKNYVSTPSPDTRPYFTEAITG